MKILLVDLGPNGPFDSRYYMKFTQTAGASEIVDSIDGDLCDPVDCQFIVLGDAYIRNNDISLACDKPMEKEIASYFGDNSIPIYRIDRTTLCKEKVPTSEVFFNKFYDREKEFGFNHRKPNKKFTRSSQMEKSEKSS